VVSIGSLASVLGVDSPHRVQECVLACASGAPIDGKPTSRYVTAVREKTQPKRPRAGAREKLLEASFALIRERGYSATSVDQLCAKAGVTKGAFFHHFKSKDALAVAAANRWSEVSRALFQTAPYHNHRDPLDRVLGYLDLRRALLKGEVAEFTCLAGTMVQEVYRTHAEIREACEASISDHAVMLEADIAEAMKVYRVRAKWSTESLALHIQAVLQGAFILAKAKGGPDIAAASIDHLRRYIELLFKAGTGRKRRITGPQALCGRIARSSSTPLASASCVLGVQENSSSHSFARGQRPSVRSGTPTASRTRTYLARFGMAATIAPLSVGRDIDTINPSPG
jgi:TetR/AcrR family transcriptional regulator, transcriptional repressor for nem operon